jgi:N-acetylmuramic acid 6-phosphate etherase
MKDEKRSSGSRWSDLLTEQRNPASEDIDERPTPDILRIINAEDQKVAHAVEAVLGAVAEAVELAVAAFRQGGRLFYVGAGTSGRLGVLDASECPPTYGADPEMVQGIIAGGHEALVRSLGKEEDFPERGAQALRDRQVSARDVVVGIAASGVTPYVRGALAEARSLGAGTVFFTCNPSAAATVEADVKIVPAVGPEVVTGSTRMKAGTATKMVLNMITTASMIRAGKVYGNLMVDLTPTCLKLEDRATRILSALAEISGDEARRTLDEARWNLKAAIVMRKRGVGYDQAVEYLRKADGIVKKALAG